MQLRMSPGGSTRYSRRKRPELPPSSVTVTTAARSAIGSGVRSFLRVATYSFSPRSTVESPVPPPSATIRTGTVRIATRFSRNDFHQASFTRQRHKKFPARICNEEFHAAKFQENSQTKLRTNFSTTSFRAMNFPAKNFPTKFRTNTRNSARRTVSLRVQQFREARVFLQKSKIFVIARVIAIFRPQLYRHLQILHRGFRFAGQAIQSSHGVNNVVRFRRRFACAVQMLASFVPAAQVHQRHTLGVMLFCGLQCRNGRPRNALFADLYVHLGAVAELLAGAFQDAFEGLLGTLELLLLEVLKGFFVEFQLCLLGGSVRVRRERVDFRLRAGLYCLLFQQFVALVGGLGSPDCATFHGHSPRKTIGNIAKSRRHVNAGFACEIWKIPLRADIRGAIPVESGGAFRGAVPQSPQALVEQVVAFQEWQHRRLALFDPAAGLRQTSGGPEVFDGPLERGNRAGAASCGHINLRQVQMKLRLFSLQLQGGLAQVRRFVPFFFRARHC